MSEHKAVFKSATVLSAFTVGSRVTGFLRSVLIANVFGTGVAAQAFLVAFKIPNMLRDVMGEGAGNAAFVPVFSEYLVRRSREEFLRLVNTLLWLVLGVAAVVTALGVLMSPVLVRLIAPGFSFEPDKLSLTIELTRILFPYLVLITLSAYMMSVSNALRSFAIPASSSIIFNLVVIAALFFIGKNSGLGAVYLLGWSVLLAGLAQAAYQFPSLARLGVDFLKGGFLGSPFGNDGVRKVGRLILPRIVGTSIYQLNVFVDTVFASLAFFVGEGAIAAIYYANLLIQFPFSVFGVSLSNAALPTLSTHAAQNDMEKFRGTLDFSFRAVFLCIIPLVLAFLVFAAPIVRVIFERGRFDAYSSAITSQALFFYSFGLAGYVGVRFLSLGFYALQDTLTPVKTASAALAANVVLNSLFIFVFKFQLAGLALASSVSATMNFVVLYRLMRKKAGYAFSPGLKNLVRRSLLASILAGAVAWVLWRAGFGGAASVASVAATLAVGAVVYFSLLWWWEVEELKELARWLRKRR